MDLLGKSLSELLNLLKAKKISSQELFDYFSSRIKKYDGDLNCYITTLNKAGNYPVSSELAGIPLSIKDIFCTNGVRTTAGSKILDDYIPQYDATVVQRLNNSGG